MSPRWRGLCLRLGLGLLALSALFFFKPLEDAYVLPQRLALGLAALLLLLGRSNPRFPQGFLWRLALAWLGWRLLCRLLAQGPGTPAWLADQCALWAAFLGACFSLGDPRARDYLGKALGLALALEALYGILGSLGLDPFSGEALDLGFRGRAFGSLGNPDFLGGWLALLSPLALAAALTAPQRLRRAAWVVLALAVAALLLTQARAAWLAGLVGLAVAAWRLRPGRWAWMAAAGLALAVVTCLGWSLANAGGRQRLAEAADLRSDAWQSRLLMSQEALALARQHPWTGVGPGLFTDGYLELQGPRLLANRSLPYRYTEDAHDDWAQAAAETGWIGLLLWAGLFALALRTAWRHGGAEGAAVAGGLAALGVQGCFHFPLSIVPCQGLVLAGLGLCVVWADPSLSGDAAQAATEAPAANWLVLGLAALVAGSLALQWKECQSSACLNRGSALDGQAGALPWRQQLLAQAASLRPEDLRAWTRLGRAYLDGQQAAAGEAAYAKATQLLPHLGEAWTGLALAQGMQGKLPEAEESGLRAVGLNPRAGEAWSNLAKVRYLRGEAGLAVDTAKQGLQQADESEGAWFNLAAMLVDQHRNQEAVPALQAVLRLDPTQAKAAHMLELCRMPRLERHILGLLLALAARGAAAVLAQAGPLTLGLAGPDSLTQTSLPFHLGAPARVWAEAAGLSGLESGRSGEAPEAFLDEQYLGPLLAEHHGSWRSPEALALDAGDHVLLLRCSSVGIPKPCGIAALRVVSDAPGPAAHTKPAAAASPPDCGHPTLSRRWPRRFHGQGLVLSVLSGRSQSAGVMARLLPGQAWACRVRLPAQGGQALPLMAHFSATPSGQGCLLLSLDQGSHGRVDALGYRPDAWEPLRISLCGGRLHVALAAAPPFDLDYPGPRLDLELAAQDVELGLKPALP